MRTKFSDEQLINHLNRHSGITVTRGTIYVHPDAVIGIKTWGKIDYLKKYLKYVVIKSSTVTNLERKKDNEDDNYVPKHNNRINIVKIVKAAMK